MPGRVLWDDDEQIIADLLKGRRRLESRVATTHVYGTHDEFTVAATPETTYQLTYIPVLGTCAMYVGGDEREEGTNYTVDYDTGIVTFTTALTTGNRINFRYLVTDWLVARSLPAETDVGIVQHAANDVSGGTSVTVTLGATPTVGNVLFAFIGRYSGRGTSADTDPSNWVAGYTDTGNTAAVSVYTRTVLSGDGTAWQFSMNSTDSMSVILVEIQGSDATPGGWTYQVAHSSSGTVSDSITLTADQLALVFATSDGGTSHSVTTVTPTGYTIDESQIPSNHTGSYGRITGTGSSQSLSTAWDGSTSPETQLIVGVTSA